MLNNIGPMGFILIAVVVLVLFGRGKISGVMGEVGKGITSFRRGMDEGRREIDEANATAARDVTPVTSVQPQATVTTVTPQGTTVTPAGQPETLRDRV